MHNIKLPRQSWRIIHAQLSNPEGWCKSTKTYKAVFSLLEKKELEGLDEVIIPQSSEQAKQILESETSLTDNQTCVLKLCIEPDGLKNWLNEELEIEISESERDAVKLCLNTRIESGLLPVQPKYMNPIFKSFGLE